MVGLGIIVEIIKVRKSQEFSYFWGRLISLLNNIWKQSDVDMLCDFSGVTGGRSVPLPQLWLGDPLARSSAAEAGTERGRPPPSTAAPEVTRP
jgi:hypothetical protein